MPSDDSPEMSDGMDFVRPFLVTAGRTEADIEGLMFETLIESVGDSGDGLVFEPARVFELCRTATGIAEISAHLNIPIATVKVVVGDLVKSGHVRVYATIDNPDDADVQLMNRIIAGVRNL